MSAFGGKADMPINPGRPAPAIGPGTATVGGAKILLATKLSGALIGYAPPLRSFLRLAPDVILANGRPAAKTMQQESRAVPVIFIASSDPVLDGLVRALLVV
jgi:hypothetical protein